MQRRQTSIDSLTGVAATLRTHVGASVGHLDTVQILKWRTRYDTALVHLTDTVRVKEALATANTTIKTCRATLSACERLAAVEKQRGDSLARQVADARKIRAPRFTRNIYTASDITGGVYAGAEARLRVLGVEAFGRYEVRLDSMAGTVRVGAAVPF